MPTGERWSAPFIRAARAGAFIASHALIAVVLIVAISAVKGAIGWFGDTKLFGVLPLGYLFDAMDAAILLVFMVFGLIEAIRVFRE